MFLEMCRSTYQASGERGSAIVRVVLRTPHASGSVFSQALFVLSASKSVAWRNVGRGLANSLDGVATEENLGKKYQQSFRRWLLKKRTQETGAVAPVHILSTLSTEHTEHT